MMYTYGECLISVALGFGLGILLATSFWVYYYYTNRVMVYVKTPKSLKEKEE